MFSEPYRWHVVYTRPHCEKRVAVELSAKQMEHYLPVFREVHQWKDRKKLVERPLFPSYVFVRFADGGRVRLEVLSTSGTVRLLGKQGQLDTVPDTEVEAIRKMLSANVPAFSHPFLQKGAWVKVERGPLKGLEGLLVRSKSQTRLVLSIALLSQSVAAELDAADVKVLRPGPETSALSLCDGPIKPERDSNMLLFATGSR